MVLFLIVSCVSNTEIYLSSENVRTTISASEAARVSTLVSSKVPLIILTFGYFSEKPAGISRRSTVVSYFG